MPTTISNPATFSSVRTAFNTEGYGLSTSFNAYRQGGGIVPSTSTFNIIGAGTAGDPLRLTQFNGFTVPALSLDTQTVTVGQVQYGTFPGDVFISTGYSSGNFGSISDGTANVTGGLTIYSLGDNVVISGIAKPGLFFGVYGSAPNSGWSTIQIGSAGVYNRSAATYTNGGFYTLWEWGSSVTPFYNNYVAGNVVTVTFA